MAPALLGKEHHEAAKKMTLNSVLEVAACFCILTALGAVLSMPLLLVLPVYVAAEVLFAIIWYYRFLLLSYQPIKHRPLSHDPVSAFEKAMAHLQQFADIRHFLSIWFHGAKWEDIKRDNVADLIAYAFWYQTRDEIAAEGRAHELEAMVQFIEHTWDIEITHGHNPQLRWMCHLWEPMRCWYQPLGFYLFMEVASVLASSALRAAGFTESFWCGLTYYTKNMPEHGAAPAPQAPAAAAAGQNQVAGADCRSSSSSGGKSDVPLVLLHGIGMGIIPYISLLFNMAATGRPVIALQFKHVAMRWVMWVPTVDEVAEVLVAILRREGVQRCCLVAHSYGTAVASRLLQQHPQKVVQTCMIDPVCFSMFMPNLLRNFLYESPRTGNWIGDFMMLCAARDLHVSATLSRKFFWTDVNLWEEQLPHESVVVLSGRDILMAASEVKAWLELRTDAVVMFHPDLLHAGFLLDLQWQQQILQQLLPLLDHKLEKEQQQQLPPPPGGMLDAQLHHLQHRHQQGEVQEGGAALYRLAGVRSTAKLDGFHVLQQHQQPPVTPQAQQQLQQHLPTSSVDTSCSMHSSLEISAVAAQGAVAAPAGLHRSSGDSSSSRCNSAFASIFTTSSFGGAVSKDSGDMLDISVSNASNAAASAGDATALHKHVHCIASKRTGSFDLPSNSCSRSVSDKGLVHTYQAPMSLDQQQQQHFVGVDSDGCVIAALICPRDLEPPAGDDGYFSRSCAADEHAALVPPAPGLTVPQSSLAGRFSAGGSVQNGRSDDAISLQSPFVAAAEVPLQQQAIDANQQLSQLQPLESWTGVVASAPASYSNSYKDSSNTPGVLSASSSDVALESPRTFFSGCSSQSWQDLAALAAARDAATAAQILLQPVQAWQQQRQRQQQERRAKLLKKEQQQRPLVQQQQGEGSSVVPNPVTVQRQGSSVSSKRDGMLRRVEVLLHRRQNRHRGSDGAAAPAAGAASLAL